MPITRIASLLASATEILYGLGLGAHVVAVSHECDFPPEALHKPRVTRTRINPAASSHLIDQQVKTACAAGESLYEINTDHLVELRPELIVTQAQCDVCAVRHADVIDMVNRRKELAGTTVLALNPRTLDDVLADVLRVAAAAGVQACGADYVKSLQSRVEAVRVKTQHLRTNQRPRIACLDWIDPPMLAGNWMPEDIVAFDPEVIVVMPCGFDLQRTLTEARTLRSFPNWNAISAVRTGRVYATDGNAYFNRSGLRLVDSLEILSGLLHPEFFEPPDPHVATRLPDGQGLFFS